MTPPQEDRHLRWANQSKVPLCVLRPPVPKPLDFGRFTLFDTFIYSAQRYRHILPPKHTLPFLQQYPVNPSVCSCTQFSTRPFSMSHSRFGNVTPASRSFLLYGPDMSLPSTISGLKSPPAPANMDDLIPVLIQAGHSCTLYLITHLSMPNSYSQMSLILFSKPLFTAYSGRNVSRICSEWRENLLKGV